MSEVNAFLLLTCIQVHNILFELPKTNGEETHNYMTPLQPSSNSSLLLLLLRKGGLEDWCIDLSLKGHLLVLLKSGPSNIYALLNIVPLCINSSYRLEDQTIVVVTCYSTMLDYSGHSPVLVLPH